LTYYPSLPPDDNTLKELNPYHGYWIKMKQADTLSITGYPLESSTPLSLAEGWNLVSYLDDISLPVSTALSSIDGLYTAVLGYEGEGLSFYTSVPPEMNTLESLKPGYGYWIRMNSGARLVYPGSD
jgi:hypothetical protein